MFMWSPGVPLVFHRLLHVSVYICTTTKSGRKWCCDESAVGWFQGADMETGVVDVFLHVNIRIVSPICLPAPLRSAGCVCTWEEERLCLWVCARCICLCMLHIWGWVSTILCSRCKCKQCIRCWLQITELKIGYKEEGKPHRRRRAFFQLK